MVLIPITSMLHFVRLYVRLSRCMSHFEWIGTEGLPQPVRESLLLSWDTIQLQSRQPNSVSCNCIEFYKLWILQKMVTVLSTTPWRRMGECMCRPTFTWHWHKLEVSDQLYARGNSPRYPLDRRLGGPQNRSWRHGEEKFLAFSRTQSPTPQSSSP
jgi:hypothetical protein